MSLQNVDSNREILELHKREQLWLTHGQWAPMCDLTDAELAQARSDTMWALRQIWEAEDKAMDWGTKV